MFRKTVIAIVATAAVAAVALPTAASAKKWHHHRHGGFGFGLTVVGAGLYGSSCLAYEWRQNRRGQWYQVLVNYCGY